MEDNEMRPEWDRIPDGWYRLYVAVGCAILAVLLLSGCGPRGPIEEINVRPKPIVVISKPKPYDRDANCRLTLRDGKGMMFAIYDCDLCNTFDVNDTILK